jgi:D-serine deaminase-like pyridoxal phosphate-dependent protein
MNDTSKPVTTCVARLSAVDLRAYAPKAYEAHLAHRRQEAAEQERARGSAAELAGATISGAKKQPR